MTITVDQAFEALNARGVVEQNPRFQPEMLIKYVERLIGRPAPKDLCDFYRKRISRVGDFNSVIPIWNSYAGWVSKGWGLDMLLPAKAIPLFGDGCGSVWGVDVSSPDDHPAVYFFDHEDRSETPSYAAGSSIGTFLMLLADHDHAIEEHWPPDWSLKIDPDIGKCPRAPPIWLAG
jgi:hypothetical protein